MLHTFQRYTGLCLRLDGVVDTKSCQDIASPQLDMVIKLKPSADFAGQKYKSIGFINKEDQAIVFSEMKVSCGKSSIY